MFLTDIIATDNSTVRNPLPVFVFNHHILTFPYMEAKSTDNQRNHSATPTC